MKARHVMLLTSALVLAGCSGSPEPAPASAPITLGTSLEAAPAVPACSDLFQPGKTIDEQKARVGCADPRGNAHIVGFFECNDGRTLFQVDASATGAKAGYGFGGKAFKAVASPEQDRGYGKAYTACMADRPAKTTVKETTMGTKPPVTVEVTAGPGGVRVAVEKTAPAATPAGVETVPPTPDLVPVPGGEWRSRPSPKPQSTEDPA